MKVSQQSIHNNNISERSEINFKKWCCRPQNQNKDLKDNIDFLF